MSQPTQPGAVVDEKTALFGGLAVSVFAVFVALAAVKQVLDVIGQLIWLAIGLYILGMMVQYWTAQSYKDGLTKKEATMAVLWPVDTYATIRAGVHRQQGISAFRGTHVPAQQDTSGQLVDEKTALWGGFAATVVIGLPLTLWGIGSVLSLTGSLIWLAILVYVVGFVVNFWVSSSYKNGLTTGEITLNALWPIDILKKIRAGVARQSAP